ncbi:MAG TPA: 3-hydroxyacyl-CoA dehydrogenase family protein, partial [Solirubrobacterales bacterium]|nr:3-hydroxyacyl-CoA dehydrogenase family protein [Solirubrobacterales bacterium]
MASLKRIGIVGAGTMGAGIAEAALLRDVPVTVVDSSAEMLERTESGIREGLAKALERGRCSESTAASAGSRLSLSGDLATLAPCDVVIEAITERLEAKRQLFEELTRICSAPAVLATNTSSLCVSAIAAGAPEPDRIVGMHFFNPVARMRLVEIVPGTETSPETLRRVRQLSEALGKQAIVARDGIGFLVNR